MMEQLSYTLLTDVFYPVSNLMEFSSSRISTASLSVTILTILKTRSAQTLEGKEIETNTFG